MTTPHRANQATLPTLRTARAVALPKTHLLLSVLAALVLAASCVLWLGAGAASAHDRLVATNPAEGSTLTTAPQEATLEFSGHVQQVGSELALLDAAGTAIALTEPFTLSGTTVTQPLPELTDGAYKLNWRVVSQDGHPVSGTINFTVGKASTPEPTNASVDLAQNTDTQTPNTATPPLVTILLSLLALLVVAAAVVAFALKLRRGNAPAPSVPSNGTAPEAGSSEPEAASDDKL